MKKFLGCVLIGILLGGGIVFLGMRINTRSSENFLAGTGNSPFQLFSQESDLEIVEAARQEFGACYAFSTLTAEEQLIYYRIYQAIMGAPMPALKSSSYFSRISRYSFSVRTWFRARGASPGSVTI